MKTLLSLLCVLLVGCGLKEISPIQNTTYPQGVYGTRTIKWPAKNPIYTNSKRVKRTFTNEHEFFIDSSDCRTTDKFKLMKAIPEKAKQECGGEYQVVYTKYYSGKEATSEMLGRRRPWLKVVVRCPLKQISPSFPGIVAVNELTKDVKDSNYFDSHSQEFDFGFDRVWNQVLNILSDQDDNIWDSDKEKGRIITDLNRHGILGFPHYDQYYIIVEKVSVGVTRVSFKLFRYFRYMNRKEPATMQTLILKPDNRHIVYRSASEFVKSISDNLKE